MGMVQMPDDPRIAFDPVNATCWSEHDYAFEGDDVKVHAELSDVDEIALVVRLPSTTRADAYVEVATVHLDRVHAIALAGQLAAAATASQTLLPHGHGPEGPAA